MLEMVLLHVLKLTTIIARLQFIALSDDLPIETLPIFDKHIKESEDFYKELLEVESQKVFKAKGSNYVN